ncbi:Aste57867_9981 [Aphanomyces stellatus]|uniref:Aste57867_9981 protein n=1 Tax=Aphanomyces stellatus TaxID=120398 RepID=A0A485KQ43_9STRA|nr:hypothetical protein As57867_009942 [Aphanomyces stellatus]VFT86859.1 Aste57867_9981 [Aphanomyces stellatus]
MPWFWPAPNQLNKVPRVTLPFWIVKVACTTLGETFSNYLCITCGLRVRFALAILAPILVVLLVTQIRLPKYVAVVYWLVTMVASIVGTLVADEIGYVSGASMWVVVVAFGIPFGLVLGIWYLVERNLSFEQVSTPRCERLYWLAILSSFPLGTAVGDCLAEDTTLGYGSAFAIFGSVMLATVVVWYWTKHPTVQVIAFWTAYILARPVGTTMGDWLTFTGSSNSTSSGSGSSSSSGSSSNGSSSGSGSTGLNNFLSLGVDAWSISVIDAVVVVVLVLYFTATKVDVLERSHSTDHRGSGLQKSVQPTDMPTAVQQS